MSDRELEMLNRLNSIIFELSVIRGNQEWIIDLLKDKVMKGEDDQ